MLYKLDLRKTIFQLSGRLTDPEIVKVFRDIIMSASNIYRVLKDVHGGKELKNKARGD